MPRYVYRGGRGVRAIPLKARKADKKGCTCAPAFLSYNSRARGTKSHISTPLDMFRFRPFFKIRFTHSIAGNIRRQGRKGNYQRRLRRPTQRGCTCAPAFIVSRRARGTEITHFNPSRYVPVPPVFQNTLHAFHRRKYPAAGALPECAGLPSDNLFY